MLHAVIDFKKLLEEKTPGDAIVKVCIFCYIILCTCFVLTVFCQIEM